MITEIKKGDRFRCVNPDHSGLFTKDATYNAFDNNTIDNDSGLSEIEIEDARCRKNFNRDFIKIESDSDTQRDLEREKIVEDELEKSVSDRMKDVERKHGLTAQINWNKEDESLAAGCRHGFPNEIELDKKLQPEQQKLIRRFKSGAVRSDNTGRPRPDWISPYAIEAISMRMVGVVNDFGSCNYMLGINEEKCLESLCRHVGELQEAILITKDKDAAKEAAQGVGFNIVAMLHTMVLKEKGLYVERFERDELVTVEEAKQGVNFTNKD